MKSKRKSSSKKRSQKHIYRVQIILKSGNVCDKHIQLFSPLSLVCFRFIYFPNFLENVSRKIIEFSKMPQKHHNMHAT